MNRLLSVPKLPYIAYGKMPGPKEGYVPDEDTAIKIAEVILFRLYGENNITVHRPYNVIEDENIWWVCRTGRAEDVGSLFKIAISKQTAAVLYLQM
jgi:NTF2 fold immunity protein